MTSHIDVLRAQPHAICIEITNKCNLRCSYCAKADDRYEAIPGNNTDMTDEMVGALYRYCKQVGIRHVSLSGVGETTMTAGWHKGVARFLDDPEISAHLVSNLVRVFDDDDLVALTKLRNLQISFDSASLAMVRKQRSKADLRTITYNIVRLRQKARELGRGPNIDVNCTLSRENIGEIANLAGFCRELGVDRLMIGEVMVIVAGPKMPATLDTLSNEDVTLLVSQIIAAEDALRDSNTAIYLQDHLRARIGELVEQMREGTMPLDSASYFHRRMESSSCRLPWSQPFVRADGKVFACCIASELTEPVVGNLATSSMAEILDGPALRAVRASILKGRPTVSCHGCQLARRESFDEFAREIREWQGDSTAAVRDSDVERTVWPGLLGDDNYPVVVENSKLTVSADTATLIEGPLKGLHRILFDLRRIEVSEISFLARPAGRRRLRLDLADGSAMQGRAHIVLTRSPRAEVALGSLDCVATPCHNRWYSIRATFRTPTVLSNINLSLMSEDGAVVYAGDGRGGLDLGRFHVQ
jgi:MoaA/NifB/PqqE/SkfB family radical SAM enzyme